MTNASAHAWFNGDIVAREAGAPSIASINLHLGTGVFDGMMAYWNEDHYLIHRGEEHLERFRRGAERLGLPIPWSVSRMLDGIEALLAQEPFGTQYVRPIAYRRAPELWVTGNKGRPVDVSIFTVQVRRDIDELLACHLSPIERISSRSIPAQTKVSGAYVNSYYARDTAERAGFDDAIMLDRDGCIAEASAANVFFALGDKLMTPALKHDVFPGVTRKVIIDIAERSGIDVDQKHLYRQDIEKIDAAFLCSTLMEIRGISRLGARELGTSRSSLFLELVREFRRVSHS